MNTPYSPAKDLECDHAEFAEGKRHYQAIKAVNAMVKAGKVLPGERQSFAIFMAMLDNKGLAQFGEENSDLKTQAEFLEAFLNGLPARFH